MNAQRAVVAFHGGQWRRGWTVKLDNCEGDILTSVFLIDEGRVVVEPSERVIGWVSEMSRHALPLALPFFLKGGRLNNVLD